MEIYGNVNVSYKPCKATGQLKSATNYILGKKESQKQSNINKTRNDLYNALGCNRDNFTNSILMNRKMHGKSYSRLKSNEILAHKLSLSFSKIDSKSLNYETAYHIGEEFAERFFYQNGFQVLFAVHIDKEHTHIHFIVSNCNMHDGKAYRRNQRDLREMSKFFGMQCLAKGLNNSIRDSFYSKNLQKEKLTYPEYQIRTKGKESFKDELREVIELELQKPDNQCFEDVMKSLYENYGIETRVSGNTVSYRHPEYKDKNGNLVSVRASKLGTKYTKRGIEYEYNGRKNRTNSKANQRTIKYEKQNSVSSHATTTSSERHIAGRRNIVYTNESGVFERERAFPTESTNRRTAPSSRELQKALSEIRGYRTKFNPEIREESESKRKKTRKSTYRGQTLQSDIGKTNQGYRDEHSR